MSHLTKRKRLTNEEAAEAIRLSREEGVPVAELCRRFGFSRTAMFTLIARSGRICPRCKEHPVERKCSFCNECSLGDDIKRARAWRKKRIAAGLCPQCSRPLAEGMSNCGRCQERRREQDREIKRNVIAGYGGKCACCGESQISFLTIDHVNDDGKHQRLHGDHGSSYRLYRKLIREGFPSYCQCLCFNCNHGRFINGGVCPHKSAS